MKGMSYFVIVAKHNQNIISGVRRLNIYITEKPKKIIAFIGLIPAIAQLDAVLARLEGQATAFVDRYEKRLAPAEHRMIQTFSSLRSRNFIMRRYLMLRYGFFYSNAMRNMGLLLLR